MASEKLIASWYIAKYDQALSRGIEFKLNLVSFRNLAQAKKCYFTGLPLNQKTRTIDRIDNRRGYISGNVVACHLAFNSLKGMIEQPNNNLELNKVIRGLNRVQQRIGTKIK